MVLAAAPALGQWQQLANPYPNPNNLVPPLVVAQLVLLPDGSVMAQDYAGAAWHRLRPDSHGSYHNGTWDSLPTPPMTNWRKFFSSCVLRDGRLFVAGGEYAGGNGQSSAEIFNPQANGGAGAWTNAAAIPSSLMDPTTNPPEGFYDSECMLLPNGDVLLYAVVPHPGAGTLIYHVQGDYWTAGGTPLGNLDESSWVKLPDNTILTVDNNTLNAERYNPASNSWFADASVPVNLFQAFETGTAMMLPSGKAFFIGGAGRTALYNPSGTNAPGTWTIGPDIPGGNFMGDAPAANLVTGNMLVAVSPNIFNGGEGPPLFFYEYRPATNSWSPLISNPGGVPVEQTYADHTNFLALPNGKVLYTHGGTDLWEYTPTGSIIPAGVPTIWNVSSNPDGSYHLIGTGLNGYSAGADYGDDYQMDTNFPLVRLTAADTTVHYCRTFNWSSTAVQTGNTLVSTEFALPAGLASGTYTLETVVNGFASGGWTFAYNSGVSQTQLVSGGAVQVFDGNGNGNNNGRVDPGENSVNLSIPIENLSFTAVVTNANATLSTTDPYVTVTSANAFYNDMGPLATSNNITLFTISVSPLRPCGTSIPFSILARGSNASGAFAFSLPTGPCTPPTDAPANDSCSTATTVVENTTYFGNNLTATTDGTSTCGGNSTQDVWFRYVASSTGTVNVDTCGSGYDTVLSVHTACPGTGANQVACNDDNANTAFGGNNACGGGVQSGLNLAVTAGTTYYIRLAGYNGAAGDYDFRILPYTPANDTCATKIAITPGTYTGGTGFGANEGSALCGNSNASPDVWYIITPAISGIARLDTCGSGYDTVLSVHTACPGTAANQIACNDDAPAFSAGGCYGTFQSSLDVPVTAGQAYTIRVSGYNGAAGPFTLHYTLDTTANEDCPDAAPIGYGTIAFNTAGAMTDGPTEANCGFCCNDLQVNQDIWFFLTAYCNRHITIDTLGSTFDTKLAVYAGCPVANNTAVVCNDDFNLTNQSSVTLAPIAGTTYYIRVGGYLTAAGAGTLHVKTCQADFDCDGTVAVADIFAFLNAWFAGAPQADINGSGLSVQDIFDFLNLWFVGCP
jgi:hypothetical protein